MRSNRVLKPSRARIIAACTRGKRCGRSSSPPWLRGFSRVEVGAENYGTIVRINGHPGAGISISLSPGSDALETADRVKTRVAELAQDFPDGLTYA